MTPEQFVFASSVVDALASLLRANGLVRCDAAGLPGLKVELVSVLREEPGRYVDLLENVAASLEASSAPVLADPGSVRELAAMLPRASLCLRN